MTVVSGFLPDTYNTVHTYIPVKQSQNLPFRQKELRYQVPGTVMSRESDVAYIWLHDYCSESQPKRTKETWGNSNLFFKSTNLAVLNSCTERIIHKTYVHDSWLYVPVCRFTGRVPQTWPACEKNCRNHENMIIVAWYSVVVRSRVEVTSSSGSFLRLPVQWY